MAFNFFSEGSVNVQLLTPLQRKIFFKKPRPLRSQVLRSVTFEIFAINVTAVVLFTITSHMMPFQAARRLHGDNPESLNL